MLLPEIRGSHNLSIEEEVELKVTPERQPSVTRIGKDVLIRKV
jgi:hypothetical protein